ncbi:tyrosine-protein phosphatase [Flavobacterium sp.]|uniref:tyrosine-protein phosphatase n=1 Tax=Flavobacterium sp. TaxID=239 RepID=UPI0037512EF8
MYFFKKKKPFLSDLISNGYVDIHSHLLPNIDDGSSSLLDTISMIKALNKLGFSQFITTPHIINGIWENTNESIAQTLKNTLVDLPSELKNIPLIAAAEYMMDTNFINQFKNEKLLTLKENYVLVEMSYINAPLNLYDIIFELQLEGYKPVLAHPERYNFYHPNFDEYKKLNNAGCHFQLNLLSTVGYYGPKIAEIANNLLKNNLIDFVGSDVHHNKHIDFFNKKIVLKNHENLKVAIQNNQFFKI